jgi:hypothetical protein
MMLTLVWKEYREHRSVWLTMVLMTGLLGFLLGQLASSQGSTATFGMGVLALTGAYGVVCGAMMLAGEREGGTLVLLDIFLGRRGLLWLGKFWIGIPLALTEGLAVALILHLLNLAPPDWMAAVLGRGSQPMALAQAERFFESSTSLWFVVLPLVAMEAFAWGLLGSAMSQRVLTGAALGVAMATPAWMTAICLPPQGFLGVRLVAALIVLVMSLSIFLARAEFSVAPPPPEPVRDPRLAVIREIEAELHLERPLSEMREERASRARDWEQRREGRRPRETVDVALRMEEVRLSRRPFKPPPQAQSPREVLLWLTFRQAALPCAVLGVLGVLLGFLVPNFGQVIWPLATLLIGVGCGTAAFAWEQSDQSYQFLAAQHFPLRTVWNVKIGFWFITALLGALVVACGGALLLTLLIAAREPGNPGGMPNGFHFGTLPGLVGWPQFLGMWLVYGFCVGQVFVLLCRKPVYAVMLSVMVSAGILGLWLPSLLGRGMSGWQVWLPPLIMLAATRTLIRAWAGGRIKERKPAAALAGFGVALFAWIAVHLGWQAVSVPDVGEPLDRVAFRRSVPSGLDNDAGQKTLEALAEIEDQKGKEAVWLAKMTEVAKLPPGVLEAPSTEGQTPILRHLAGCRVMADRLHTLANAAITKQQWEPALEHIVRMLALSRNLRNKAPFESFMTGVQVEERALTALELWLIRAKPSAELLTKGLEELNRHGVEAAGPLDCLRTECYRTGGVLANTTMWSFHSSAGRVPERWLADTIAFSLDTPWENERAVRLWRAAWAGFFRAIETPAWQRTKNAPDLGDADPVARRLLAQWLPATEGPGASLTAAELARELERSWLVDDRLLMVNVAALRSAGDRSRWQVDASRVAFALALYQAREGKAAAKLDDLTPRYLTELPVDPYSGAALHYRVSEGERRVVAGDGARVVEAGWGILWSTGPDGQSDGGRIDGRRIADHDAQWTGGGMDLVMVVPKR